MQACRKDTKSEEVPATGKATGDVSATGGATMEVPATGGATGEIPVTGGATGEVPATGKAAMEVQAGGKATKEVQAGNKATMTGNAVGEGTANGTQIRKRDGVLINSLGMEFVLIKPGNFVMGSPPGNGAETGNGTESGTGTEPGNDSESGKNAESGNGVKSDNDTGNGTGEGPYDEDEKQHLVTIKKGSHFQTTEVTVGQFRKFIQTTGYVIDAEKKGSCWVRAEGGVWRQKKGIGWDSHRSWESAKYAQTEKHPVTCVSWNDALAFIQWLSRKEGVTYELPTEAEWEYACRAGTTTPFSFGLCLSTDQADYGGGGGGGGGDSPSVNSLSADCRGSYHTERHRPIEVGSLDPNPWKLFDMHGNVTEWCQDWYAPYPDTDIPLTDPKGPAGPSGGTERVMRGGHWAVNDSGCRSAKRWSFPPDDASEAIGFRLVMRTR